MASDKEVLREIWNGKLPICFVLDMDEVSDFQTPDSYFLLVSRLTYFPLVWDKVRKHFIKHINKDRQETEMWLDHNGTPLRWHYPIGLLFDLHATDAQLPWTVTVHFKKFPETELLRCANRDVVEAYFMSVLKEADALKHNGQVIKTMQKKDHIQLWLGLHNDKFDQFWSANRKLMDSSGNDGRFIHVPFRCYSSDDTPFVQRLVKPSVEDGEPKSLFNLIQEIFPNICDNVRIITHGIELPLDTPLQWMSEHLSYPDNFLHLCIFTN